MAWVGGKILIKSIMSSDIIGLKSEDLLTNQTTADIIFSLQKYFGQ